MKINKFVYKGQKVDFDIHFTINGKLCRYGSDDEPKPQLSKCFRDLCDLAGGMADKVVEVTRIGYSYSDKGETLASVECKAATSNGEMMKIALPKFGYTDTMKPDGNGGYEKAESPIGTDAEGVQIIKDLAEALIDYVQNGNGQLQLDFQNEHEGEPKIMQFVR